MKRLLLLLIPAVLLAACSSDDLFNSKEVPFDLKGVSLNKQAIDGMITGEERKLLLSFTPAEATDKSVEWSSSDESVAVVSDQGVVKATGLGEAEITVRSLANPELAASCLITVDKTSGITVTDVLLEDVVDSPLVFLRGDENREYTLQAIVYNSLDASVNITSTNPSAMGVETKIIDGKPGFTLKPGESLGTGEIVIASVTTPEVAKRIPFSLITVNVQGVKLSMNADGNEASQTLAGQVTVGLVKRIRVVFETDNANVKTPENKVVHCVSANTSVATVPATGYIDPATNFVYVDVTMSSNTAINGQSTQITVTADGTSHAATFTVTAKMPAVQQIVLNQTTADPVVAGGKVNLTFKTVPEDAYVQTVTWSMEKPGIATVVDGVVTILPGFAFDPANYTATEFKVRATTNDASAVFAECLIKPYQYVPATGVMITDNWGNRIPGHTNGSIKDTKASKQVGIQYTAGTQSKSTLWNIEGTWGTADPTVHKWDIDNGLITADFKLGSIKMYLTATPWPCKYPNIADPNQEFLWGAATDTRFCIANPAFPNGDTGVGMGKYTGGDSGASTDLIRGRTLTFWTAHSNTGADCQQIRVYRIDPTKVGAVDRTEDLLLRFGVHTRADGEDANNNIVLMLVSGKKPNALGRIYRVRRPTQDAYTADPAPWPWPADAPDPHPVTSVSPDYIPAVIAKIRSQAFPTE